MREISNTEKPVFKVRGKLVDYEKNCLRQAGFTLVELLVVIGLIAVLAGLLSTALTNARERARRAGCMSNLKQLALSSQMYAHDDGRQSFSAKQEPDDANLNWLLPFCGGVTPYVCPSTKNFIRTNISVAPFTFEPGLVDLFRTAGGRRGPGMSYQGVGFLGVNVEAEEEIPVYGGTRKINGIRKGMNNVQSYRHFHDAFGLKGTMPGPSGMWIIMDDTLPGIWYYPDEPDNHGASGANIGFCDGHVEWIPQRNYVKSYEYSQDENRTGIDLTW